MSSTSPAAVVRSISFLTPSSSAAGVAEQVLHEKLDEYLPPAAAVLDGGEHLVDCREVLLFHEPAALVGELPNFVDHNSQDIRLSWGGSCFCFRWIFKVLILSL